MENSDLEAEIDSQHPLSLEGRTAGNFPISHDTIVALRKSPSLQVLLGVSPKIAWANVTLIGKDKENESPAGKIDDGLVLVALPHLLDCQKLSRMELRKKYRREAQTHAGARPLPRPHDPLSVSRVS